MNLLEQFRYVHTFIFDVDGVLTDSSLLILESGKLLRRMNTRDGFAMKQALRAGLRISIITGGNSAGVIDRLRALGIRDIYAGVEDKVEAYEELLHTYDLHESGICYMGDDLPDYEVMQRVGVPACPADAAPEIKAISSYISPWRGGEGCVRDVIEKVLKLRGQWVPHLIPPYLPQPPADKKEEGE